MDALSRYSWPGNIRELQNLMEQAALLSTGLSLRVPLAEILNDSVFVHLAGEVCWSKPSESRFCERFARAIGLWEVLVARQLAWASRGRPWPTRCRSWGFLALPSKRLGISVFRSTAYSPPRGATANFHSAQPEIWPTWLVWSMTTKQTSAWPL